MNRHQPSKPVPTTNSFEELENELNDVSTRMRKRAKPSPIFITRVNNFSSFSQLSKEIVAFKYEIKIINEQTKIQPKSSIAYINIVKELKSKNAEFHIYKYSSIYSSQTYPRFSEFE
jgi:hypothetical protein